MINLRHLKEFKANANLNPYSNPNPRQSSVNLSLYIVNLEKIKNLLIELMLLNE